MGRYKEKNCPTCGTTHRKQGVYCSRSCGNSRVHTHKSRKNISEKITQHWQTAESNEQRDKLTAQGKLQMKKMKAKSDEDLQSLTLDDFMIEPQVDDLGAGQFRAGGDLWTEVD